MAAQRDRAGTARRSILGYFLTNFENMFGVRLEVFFEKNVVLLAWQLICRKSPFINLFVCYPLADISKIAILPAWELDVR